MELARILIFYLMQIAASTYAIWRGGAPERAVATLLLVAAVGSSLIPVIPGRTFFVMDSNVIIIDLLLLSVLVMIAVRADRFWPIWLASLQLVAIGVHGVRAYDPHILPIVYARVVGEIAYPMLALLVIGTVRHHSRALRLGGERDWSPFKW